MNESELIAFQFLFCVCVSNHQKLLRKIKIPGNFLARIIKLIKINSNNPKITENLKSLSAFFPVLFFLNHTFLLHSLPIFMILLAFNGFRV